MSLALHWFVISAGFVNLYRRRVAMTSITVLRYRYAPMAEFTIDPEFRDLLPPLSEDERQKLMASLNADGCREPLVVWAEESILIDGHNRYAICNDLSLTYAVVTKSFKTRDDVKMWMFRNQLGRRNLTDFHRAQIALLMKPVVESQARAKQAAGRPKEAEKEVVEILPQDTKPGKKTRDIVGEIAGVSGKTIDKVEKILANAAPEVIDQVRRKEKSIEAAYKEVTAPKPPKAVEPVEEKPIQQVGVGVERAHEAIACLRKIPAGDALRKRAFEIVTQWIKKNP